MGMAMGRSWEGPAQSAQTCTTGQMSFVRLGALGATPLKHLEIIHSEGQPQSREQQKEEELRRAQERRTSLAPV